MRFHTEDENLVTVGVRRYVLEVPYGVVEMGDTRVTGLHEKPTIEFFVNAGIYAMSPEAVSLMSDRQQAFDMTDLIAETLAKGLRVGGFPIHEYWLDIGQLRTTSAPSTSTRPTSRRHERLGRSASS